MTPGSGLFRRSRFQSASRILIHFPRKAQIVLHLCTLDPREFRESLDTERTSARYVDGWI